MNAMGRPPIPPHLKPVFVTIGFTPAAMVALRAFQRRAGISTTTEACRVLVTRSLIADGLIDPDATPPPPKRKAPR
jgi:hypothetical protein